MCEDFIEKFINLDYPDNFNILRLSYVSSKDISECFVSSNNTMYLNPITLFRTEYMLEKNC